MRTKDKKDKKERKVTIENYRWFAKFSPVEKLKIAKRAAKFLEILKNAK